MFKKSSSVDAALNFDSSAVRLLSTAKDPVVTGMKSKYNFIVHKHVQHAVFHSDVFLTMFIIFSSDFHAVMLFSLHPEVHRVLTKVQL